MKITFHHTMSIVLISGERTSYVHLGDGYCGPTFSGQEHHQVDVNWIMMSQGDHQLC